MFTHKASHSLQLGAKGLGAKDIVKQGQCLEGNRRVPHVNALLALCERELEELHLNGTQLTSRAIEKSLLLFSLMRSSATMVARIWGISLCHRARS